MSNLKNQLNVNTDTTRGGMDMAAMANMAKSSGMNPAAMGNMGDMANMAKSMMAGQSTAADTTTVDTNKLIKETLDKISKKM